MTAGPAHRHVRLAALLPSDYPTLFRAEVQRPTLELFRHRAEPPAFEQFVARLWEGVCCQFKVAPAGDGEDCLGLVGCYAADHRNRHAKLLALSTGAGPWLFEAVEELIDYLFDQYDFVKLYIDVLSPNWDRISSAARGVVDVEGILRDHERVDGGRVDLVIGAIHRTRWRSRDERRRPLSDQRDADAFCAVVGEIAGSEVGLDTPIADLGLDSLGLFELLVAMESWAETSMPDAIAESLITVRDAWWHASSHRS